MIRYFFAILAFAVALNSCIKVEPSLGDDYSAPTVSVVKPVLEPTEAELSTMEIKEEYLSQQALEQRQEKLVDAEADFNEDPDNEENIIWYGRRLAYLGRYQDAINVFTEGLVKFPRSYKLRRHRGHRYLTTRQFDLAINDLTEAAFYTTGVPNEIEPDGIPNSLNRPLTNIKWNIWYHLGLSYYLKGNYDKAISSYKKCLEFATNDDLQVKTTNWLYVSYRKIGNNDASEALASLIHSNMNLIEGESRIYHDLIKLYREFVTPDILLRRYTSSGELNTIIGYGVGNFYLMGGDIEQAQAVLNRVIAGSQKDSFGYIASETELATLANSVAAQQVRL
jgi:tetratricopeptide (TPR) repeat protein